MQDFFHIPKSWSDPVPSLSRIFVLTAILLFIESLVIMTRDQVPRIPSITLLTIVRGMDVMILAIFGPWSLKSAFTSRAIKDSLFIALTFSVAGILCLMVWKKIMGSSFPGSGGGIVNPSQPLLIFFFITACLLSPIAEELLFRGLFFRKMREKWNIWASTFVVSCLFALIHFIFKGHAMAAIMPFVGSLLFCLGYEKTKFILTPILLHIGGNLIIYLSPYVSFI